MPVYEYECRDCGVVFEEIQSINDEPLEKCVECGGTVKRIISVGSFQLGMDMNPKEYYERVIRPEAKRIADKIKGGDEDAAADILGEK